MTWQQALSQPAPLLAVALILLVGGLVGYRYASREQSPLPPAVEQQLSFSPLILSGESDDLSASEYVLEQTEEDTTLLAYRITRDDATINVSQYPQPLQFTEIPEYRERFLTSIVKQTETVQTATGVVYLGRGTLNNKQIAVMLERGLIVLFSPSKDLDAQSWRTIVEQLDIYRISN